VAGAPHDRRRDHGGDRGRPGGRGRGGRSVDRCAGE
jgi:hypothetical protein